MSARKPPAKKTPAKPRAKAAKPAAKPASKTGRLLKAKRGTTKATMEKRKTAAAKRAEKAAERARRAGARGPNGTDAQRAIRDTAVIARCESGARVEDVAEEFAISTRSVEGIRAKRAAMPSPLDSPPMDILEGLAKDYRSSVADFLAMAHAHAGVNPNVALGAMKGAITARERYVELLNLVGKLPENLELFRAEGVLRRIADEMVEVMEKVETGETSAIEAAEFFRKIVAGSESAERARQIPEAV